MNIADIIGSAAGGSILGTVFNFAGRLIEPWNKKREAQVEIMLLEARSSAAEKTEAWKAFTASQEGNTASLAIPAGVPPWIASFYLCVDAIKQLTRPLLTWAAIAVIATVYLKATPEARAAMSAEILFGSFTAIFWWFGARYAKSK